ncbi:MAG: COX aromatic rich motif-containing protein [Verrucomicrobia bacterium]|nr:COX aromatic rich motif-containing protein [Verrucomicrobiota bacterium]
MQPYELITFLDHIAILVPKGYIAREQRNLLLILQAVMLLIIIPVYLFTYIFSWKYSAEREKRGAYDPDLVDNKTAEYFWWGVPTVLTLAIAVLTYFKTDQLDPYKPIPGGKKHMTIQVVALQWKWLFIYPDEQIASVNFLQFPKETPIRFEITADAPMNSFWIPHLGGQIYAMPGMKTLLHLIADEAGEYRGCSANLSGEGFAGMSFVAKASTEEEFQDWVSQAKESSWINYEELAKPSSNHPVQVYQAMPAVFDEILMKYKM